MDGAVRLAEYMCGGWRRSEQCGTEIYFCNTIHCNRNIDRDLNRLGDVPRPILGML